MATMLLSLVIVVQAAGQTAPQTAFPFVATLEEARKEAKDRRAALLFCNFDEWSPRGARLENVLADLNLANVVRKTVCVLSSQEKHGSIKQVIDGTERQVCQKYGWTPCSSHKAALDFAFRKFGQAGVLDCPHFFLVGPDDKVVVSLAGHEIDAGTLSETIDRAVADLPPSLDQTTYRRCQNLIEQAAAAEKAKDFLIVRENWETVQILAKGFPLAEEAPNVLVRLNDLGRARKTELVAAVEKGDKLQNLIALDDLAFGLGDLAAAEQARTAVDGLLSKSPFAELKDQLEQHRSARDLYFKARNLATDGKKDPARRALIDLTTRFPKSSFEAPAQKLLNELTRKPKKP